MPERKHFFYRRCSLTGCNIEKGERGQRLLGCERSRWGEEPDNWVHFTITIIVVIIIVNITVTVIVIIVGIIIIARATIISIDCFP